LPSRELFVAPALANAQTISDGDLRYITSFVDSLDIALLSSDKDHLHYFVADLDSAAVFLRDSSMHFLLARNENVLL
jgi:hypothetical protein